MRRSAKDNNRETGRFVDLRSWRLILPGADLLFHTQQPDVDEALTLLVGLYETSYPHSILSYYLEGSYADGSAIATSDVDLVLIGQTGVSLDMSLWSQHYPDAQISLDITVLEEAALAQGITPQLKLGGKLLYGIDICQNYSLIPLEQWAHDRIHAAY